MASILRTKKPMTGVLKSVDLARNETRRGAKQSRKHGSTSPFGWLRTNMHAPPRGTRSTPDTSTRRKKTRSANRRTLMITRLARTIQAPAEKYHSRGRNKAEVKRRKA